MPIRLGVLFLILLSVPRVCAQEDPQFIAALAEINQAFRNHGFDPSIISAPFDRRQLDPRIIEMEWNGVRAHVEHTLNTRLNQGIRSVSLPCVFRPLPADGDPKGWPDLHLIPVFVFEKGNARAKAALKLALGLRDDALWDYEPPTGRISQWHAVCEAIVATIGDFNPQYLTRGGDLDLVKIQIALQEVVNGDDNFLKKYHLQAISAHIVQGSGLQFATVWKPSWRTRFVAYAWRMKVILVRNSVQGDAWEFTIKIELGKRYASQVNYTVIGDSQRGDFSLLGEHMHIRFEKGKGEIFRDVRQPRQVETTVTVPSEPIKAEVPPPIERITAGQASPLESLVSIFADLCQTKLLKKG